MLWFDGLEALAYDVILADPPWSFSTWSATGQNKSASQHYDVMSFDDMKRLPVADLARNDCVLVMWATQAMIPQAVDLMRAWEFTPKTMGAWAKRSRTDRTWAFGTGYIFRSAAEFYLLGTRGKPKMAVRDVRNLIVAPAREHSRKPNQLHHDLERMFPGARRVELFARCRRSGWECWGNHVDRFEV